MNQAELSSVDAHGIIMDCIIRINCQLQRDASPSIPFIMDIQSLLPSSTKYFVKYCSQEKHLPRKQDLSNQMRSASSNVSIHHYWCRQWAAHLYCNGFEIFWAISSNGSLKSVQKTHIMSSVWIFWQDYCHSYRICDSYCQSWSKWYKLWEVLNLMMSLARVVKVGLSQLLKKLLLWINSLLLDLYWIPLSFLCTHLIL